MIENTKWNYVVQEKRFKKWKLIRFYPMTKTEVNICVGEEHRPFKIITWDEALDMQRIKK